MTMRWIALLLLAGLLVLVALLSGCGGEGGADAVLIPNAYQGTWMAAAIDNDGDLATISLFTVAADGGITVNSGDAIASGDVTAAGALSVDGNTGHSSFSGTGTFATDDSGEGVWTEAHNSQIINSGTLELWRANGAAFAGIWDVVVTGGGGGAGTVTVDANGVAGGSVTVGGTSGAVFGVVTGSGRVVVGWKVASQSFFGAGPASGSASGSSATGDWQSSGGLDGTWTATKR